MRSPLAVSPLAVAAVIATAKALVTRDTVICCFGLSATGGSSGPVGQIDDGQVRLGSGLQPGQFCIDSSGAIKDGNGRGCFLTRMFQLRDLTSVQDTDQSIASSTHITATVRYGSKSTTLLFHRFLRHVSP